MRSILTPHPSPEPVASTSRCDPVDSRALEREWHTCCLRTRNDGSQVSGGGFNECQVRGTGISGTVQQHARHGTHPNEGTRVLNAVGKKKRLAKVGKRAETSQGKLESAWGERLCMGT